MKIMKSVFNILAIVLVIDPAIGFYVHEDVQEPSDNSTITSIKIMYTDNITATHLFPDSFWVEVKSTKAADSAYKFQFELIDDPSVNVPVNLWTTDLNGKAFKRHHQVHAEAVESFASYTLVNSDVAMGVATLIRNDKNSNQASSSSSKHRHMFRMIGSITYENNFIEIVPYITKDQAAARKKRSVDDGGVYAPVFDEFENTHMVSDKVIPDIEFAEPIVPVGDVPVIPLPVASILDAPIGSFGSRKKRQSSKTQYYVEVAAVLDKSAYDMHQRYYQVTDANLIQAYMRMYYAHMFFTVNNYYQYSFVPDATTNFNIVLTNILIYQDPAMTTWTNPTIVGNTTIRNGRDSLDSSLVLNNFASSMVARAASLPFTFDNAVAIFNKDLYTSGSYGVCGVAYLSGVCVSTLQYLISEDFGGSSTSFTIAHELGHNLGSDHDGSVSSASCSSSDNFIMTPIFGSSTLQTNNYMFSSCSIAAFKSTAATKNCMSNVPTPVSDIALIAGATQGQIFDANAQCKLMYGTSGVYAQSSNSICTQLMCFTSTASIYYTSTGPAFEGTTCGSGMWCQRGLCVSNSSAPTGTCLYGDTLILSPDGTTVMYCEAGLQAFATAWSTTVPQVCVSSSFSAQCCSTCKKYSSLASCKNAFSNCDSFRQYCGTSATLSGGGISGTVDTLCPITCGKCSASATCVSLGSVCRNGATCSNNPSGQYGFTCNCPPGFYGALCEYRIIQYTVDGVSSTTTKLASSLPTSTATNNTSPTTAAQTSTTTRTSTGTTSTAAKTTTTILNSILTTTTCTWTCS